MFISNEILQIFIFENLFSHRNAGISPQAHDLLGSCISEGVLPEPWGGLFSRCCPLWCHHTEDSLLLLEGGRKQHSQWTLTCGFRSRSWACSQNSESKAAPSSHGLGDLLPPLASDSTTSRGQRLTAGNLRPSHTA